MRIVSWNCHYGLDESKSNIIRQLYDSKTDVLVIQECAKSDYDREKSSWKFKNWYGDDLEPGHLGIAIFSNDYEISFSNQFNRNFRYVVPYVLKKGSWELTLFSVWTKSEKYGLHDYDKNVTEAVKISEYQDILKKNAILIGDFNTGRNETYEDRYKRLVDNLPGFIDCANEKYIPTFYHYFDKEKPYQNDFCFISKTLIEYFKDFKVLEHEKWIKPELSDHCPISIEFDL